MKHKPLWLKWALCLIPLFAALLMYFLLPMFPRFTEYVFSRGIFRIFGFPFQWLMSALPFSFVEIVVILSIPIIITLLTVFIIKIIKSVDKARFIEKAFRLCALFTGTALLIYMVMHGANYYRLPLADLMKLPNRQYTAEDLYDVTCDIAKKAAKIREDLPEDQNGCAIFSTSENEILKFADDCYDSVSGDYPFLKTGVRRVKPVMFSHYWSYTATTGVYCPWTAEANINNDVPQYRIPHTATHEIAHTMGIAKEDECNFISWLACSQSGIKDFEYSGYLAAFTYCINTLYDADKELWKKALSECSDGMMRDLENDNTYWDSFKGEIMENSQNFNDSFIKANGVESGILSYDLMVELLLRYYDIDVI